MAPPPVIVFDSNRDALSRRLEVVRSLAPGREVTGVASRTGLLLLAEFAPESSLVLVDLFATDRLTLDRPGERLIRRLAASPATAHVRPMAWSAQSTPDVIAGVREAGADGFVPASLDAGRERDHLLRALAGEAVWPVNGDVVTLRSPAAWEAWFQSRFGLAWEPWIEPTLVRLASGRERSATVEELVALEAARSPGHAATRMRNLARAVVGEHRNSAVAVAGGASLALSQIAAHRKLAERPEAPVSLEQGARTIRTAPSLARAAGLTGAEIDEVLGMDDLISDQRVAAPKGAGAPPADEVRNERLWAAGRRAIAKGASREDVDSVVAGILSQLDQALIAIDDARQDELYHPEGRAAAALLLVTPDDSPALPDTSVRAGVVEWRGLDPARLAVADEAEVTDLHRFSEDVDALVLGRNRW